jgi:hypothetical protein
MHKTEIDEIEGLAKKLENDNWVVSFSHHSFYRDKYNQEYYLNSGSGIPLDNCQFISAMSPDVTLKLIAYVRRLEKVRMCGLPILDYLKNHDKDIWKGEIGFDFERALKEASDE